MPFILTLSARSGANNEKTGTPRPSDAKPAPVVTDHHYPRGMYLVCERLAQNPSSGNQDPMNGEYP